MYNFCNNRSAEQNSGSVSRARSAQYGNTASLFNTTSELHDRMRRFITSLVVDIKQVNLISSGVARMLIPWAGDACSRNPEEIT